MHASDHVALPAGSHSTARRQSMAKLHSVTLEAPITRVISIITAAQENSPAYVSQALEKVLEILRSKELYSPQFISNAESIKPLPADPVATDLLGALLSVRNVIDRTHHVAKFLQLVYGNKCEACAVCAEQTW